MRPRDGFPAGCAVTVSPDGAFVDYTSREPGAASFDLGRVPFLGGRPRKLSRDVLSASPGRLGVIQLPGDGWTDLSQPSRVLDVLANRPTSASIGPNRAL